MERVKAVRPAHAPVKARQDMAPWRVLSHGPFRPDS
jgi:hypothetical protein